MGVLKALVLRGYLLKYLGPRAHGWEADLLSNDSERKVYVRACPCVQWHRHPQIKQMAHNLNTWWMQVSGWARCILPAFLWVSEVFMMQKMQGVGGLKFTLQEAGYTGCLQATGWLEERRRRHMLTDVYTFLCLLNFESKLVRRLWVIVKLNLESNKGLRIIYTKIKFVFKNLLLCNMNAL